MDLHNYINYVIVAFLTITSPGAAILLSINTAMSLDMKAVFFSTLGNAIGLFMLSTLAILGVGILIKTSTVFYTVLKVTGGLYLSYLGVLQIKNKHTFHIKKEHKKGYYDTFKVFKRGFLVAATNPKPILFFSAVFPLFMDAKRSIPVQFFIMTFTFIFISFCSLMFYGYISQRSKAWFFNEEKLKIFYKVTGTLFILMGITLALI